MKGRLILSAHHAAPRQSYSLGWLMTVHQCLRRHGIAHLTVHLFVVALNVLSSFSKPLGGHAREGIKTTIVHILHWL